MKVPRINLLISYYYIKKISKAEPFLLNLAPYANTMIDSGAYSNRNLGITFAKRGEEHPDITLEEYIDVARRWQGRIWGYAALDVPGNATLTRYNLEQMWKAGLNPMPVLSHDETMENVPFLIQNEKRLCVGGVNWAKNSFALSRYQNIIDAGGKDVWLHSLGWVRWPEVFQAPIHSADSSSFCSGGRFGQLVFYERNQGFITYERTDMIKRNPRVQNALGRLRNFNMTRQDLEDSKKWHTTKGVAAMTAIYSYLKFHIHAYERKMLFFFASPNVTWFIPLFAILPTIHEKGFDYPSAAANRDKLVDLYVNHTDEFFKTIQKILIDHTEWKPEPWTTKGVAPDD